MNRVYGFIMALDLIIFSLLGCILLLVAIIISPIEKVILKFISQSKRLRYINFLISLACKCNTYFFPRLAIIIAGIGENRRLTADDMNNVSAITNDTNIELARMIVNKL